MHLVCDCVYQHLMRANFRDKALRQNMNVSEDTQKILERYVLI